MPIVYLFYPETAARTLEDVDRLFRDSNGSIWVFRDKEAISTRRPPGYEEHERREIRRASSVDAAALKEMGRARVAMEKEEPAADFVEKV